MACQAAPWCSPNRTTGKRDGEEAQGDKGKARERERERERERRALSGQLAAFKTQRGAKVLSDCKGVCMVISAPSPLFLRSNPHPLTKRVPLII